MFAAVGMGAGVTEMYSDFNQNWGWAYGIDGGSGVNRGPTTTSTARGARPSRRGRPRSVQVRVGAHPRARRDKAPFLIMHGTDGSHGGVPERLGFYNALRFNGKSAVLLAYPGEGHGLRGLANRRDLTIRFFEFFNHYLKGAPAPKWMAEGVPYLEKDRR